MGYVDGKKGIYIKQLKEKSDKEFFNNNYELAISLMESAWNELPDDKISYYDSFDIITDILYTAIVSKNKEKMNQWIDKLFIADPDRIEAGEREYWAGKVEYELGNFDKAKEYFGVAYKKSTGRCFDTCDENDLIYLNFYKENKI